MEKDFGCEYELKWQKTNTLSALKGIMGPHGPPGEPAERGEPGQAGLPGEQGAQGSQVRIVFPIVLFTGCSIRNQTWIETYGPRFSWFFFMLYFDYCYE
jgi:hypothetical protein